MASPDVLRISALLQRPQAHVQDKHLETADAASIFLKPAGTNNTGGRGGGKTLV